MLLGRARRDDDGVVRLQKRFHFRIGHLAEEHRRWFHGRSIPFALITGSAGGAVTNVIKSRAAPLSFAPALTAATMTM
jgi:hypothetical protein